MKLCSRCGEVKPRSEFSPNTHNVDGLHYRCRPCRSDIEWERRLASDYGITPADYARMLLEQAGRCAICGTTKPSARTVRFAVDHNHETGQVRGLLCIDCNNGIGRLGDDADRLIAAATYIIAYEGYPLPSRDAAPVGGDSTLLAPE